VVRLPGYATANDGVEKAGEGDLRDLCVKAQRLTLEWMSVELKPIRLAEIGARSKRHRKSALDDYLGELDMAFRQIYRVLKGEGTAL